MLQPTPQTFTCIMSSCCVMSHSVSRPNCRIWFSVTHFPLVWGLLPAALSSMSLLVFSAVCGFDKRSVRACFSHRDNLTLRPLPVSAAADAAPVTPTNWWLIIDAPGRRERRCQKRQVGLWIMPGSRERKTSQRTRSEIITYCTHFLYVCVLR